MDRCGCDEQVLARDGSAVVAYACELFIRHLTIRAWAFAERSTRYPRVQLGPVSLLVDATRAPPACCYAHRHTLQRHDLLGAIMSDEGYDFLIDVTSETLIADADRIAAAETS